jgi:hypothetical protein
MDFKEEKPSILSTEELHPKIIGVISGGCRRVRLFVKQPLETYQRD